MIYSDSSKFQKLSIDQNKVLDHVIHRENTIIDVPTKIKIKKIISEKKYEDLYPVGSSPAILYDGVSPLWPVFSALSTPIYKPSKFLTLNEYQRFIFICRRVSNYIPNMIMASFDVVSLFTNISLPKTIDLSLELLFNEKPNIDVFNITHFHELLTITMSELLVLFDGEYCKHIDGVATGSP